MRVSIVIPCYNPKAYLLEAVASARAQTSGNVEIILVNDGSDDPESLAVIESAAALSDRYIKQSNGGLPAARNAGFRAASCAHVVPLDADDLLRPEFVAVCLSALERHPEAAFAYADCAVFGTENYVDRLPAYNLYRLLDINIITYAAVIRRQAWEAAGGYDESMRWGYEDWEFWLRLGARGQFGWHTPGALFRYRKHGPSLLAQARAHHDEIVGYMRAKHRRLYAHESRRRLKARWEPIVCILSPDAGWDHQSIYDCAIEPVADLSRASAFLMPGSQPLDPHSAELAALAVWGGRERVLLPDGSVALARRSRTVMAERNIFLAAEKEPRALVRLPSIFENLQQHLVNAELLSLDSWLRHPVRSAMRLIPLRVKERVNDLAGRSLFDLTFYLRFQPRSAVLPRGLPEPLVYMPRFRSARRRVGLITPHLGAGGAEQVLLEVAAALDREQYESFLIATDSAGSRQWLPRWREAVDHVYDLGPLVDACKLPGAVYSIVANWRLHTVLLQNSLVGYSLVPHWKEHLPTMQVIDLIHAVDNDWDILEVTEEVADGIDLRVVISETVRQRLLSRGVAPEKVRLIRNGIDAEHFTPAPADVAAGRHRILFAGRLYAVKRPLLLVEIAAALHKRRRSLDFRFVVAGDGPEAGRLARRIRQRKLEDAFELLGHVPDIAPELGRCDLLVLPSRIEGIPLVVLEAFAAAKPVVASAVGGIPEIVKEENGWAIPTHPREVEAFAEAIHTLLEAPGLRRAMGENGRRLILRDFTRQASREAYRELFRAEVQPASRERIRPVQTRTSN